MKKNNIVQTEETDTTQSTRDLIRYINLKLATMGQPVFDDFTDVKVDERLSDLTFLELTENLISNYRIRTRLIDNILSPADQRIQDFIHDYTKDLNLNEVPKLPHNTFISDKPGVARILSLPPHHNHYQNEIYRSCR
ncbi:hypothetical protein MASR1M74_28410 [Lentimicrobium sp.]